MGLNILILSDAANYANNRIKEAATKRGHKAVITSPDDFIINFATNGKMQIYVNDAELADTQFDAVIPRLGTNRAYGTFILRCLIDHLHLTFTASPEAIDICSNKILTAYHLAKAKLPQPRTTTVRNPDNFKFLTESVGNLPCVLKTFSGSKGNGIYLLETPLQSSITLKNLRTAKFDLLLQSFIVTAKDDEQKSDIRCWVVGERVVAAFKRFSTDSDFRSNYSISKMGEKVMLTKEEEQLAVKAAQAVDIYACGVDIARDIKNNKQYIYEVNSCADLKGIEAVTGFDVANELIKWVEGIDLMRKKNSPVERQSTNFLQMTSPSVTNGELTVILERLNVLDNRLNNIKK